MKQSLHNLIRNVPDFPRQGIQFKDITPLLQNAEGFKESIDWCANIINKIGEVDLVAGIESRGFILGSALAYKLGVGFIPVRKQGKLPAETARVSYQLEYGTDALEIHTDAIKPRQKIALIDDLLATGGTAGAACQLLEICGANVTSAIFLIELKTLQGRQKIETVAHDNIFSLIEL